VSESGAPRVVVASDEAIDEHDTGPRHPERHQRLAAVTRGIAEADLGDDLAVLDPASIAPARTEDLERVHRPRFLRALEHFIESGGGALDPDTPVSAGSWRTALAAAGAGLAAVATLRGGGGDAAFVAVRPPGHHATRDRAQGFCLLNNVAIAAASLADAGERVLIVDWDVHHGNGTQDIFWDDPRVLYVSTHQWPAYPGTGPPNETGGAGAPGSTINVPLPPGATGDVALAALDDVVAPAAASFAPSWVLISAGFDAHRDDPLADLAWSAGDYSALTARVIDFAPARGRVVAFLEGGYDLDALRQSVTATVAGLAGESAVPEPRTHGGPGREHVLLAATAHARAVEHGPT
jgi:acetoin utilization deacetylase AcuC-like enzyme